MYSPIIIPSGASPLAGMTFAAMPVPPAATPMKAPAMHDDQPTPPRTDTTGQMERGTLTSDRPLRAHHWTELATRFGRQPQLERGPKSPLNCHKLEFTWLHRNSRSREM